LATGVAAARAGRWAEADALLRATRTRLALDKTPGQQLRILGILWSPPVETTQAYAELWLAWVNTQDGRRPDADVLAWTEHAAAYFRKLHADNDPGDHVHRYLAAFAEIALARARLVAGNAAAAEARAGLDAAAAHLAAMTPEFQATTWVKDLSTWLTATRSLLP
jgi:hypothetical protein